MNESAYLKSVFCTVITVIDNYLFKVSFSYIFKTRIFMLQLFCHH